jgi:hypothetical protein
MPQPRNLKASAYRPRKGKARHREGLRARFGGVSTARSNSTPQSGLVAWLHRVGEEPHAHRTGLISMIAMSLAYTLVSIFLAIIGGTPNPTPFLRIPSEEYFFWASFFYAPLLLLGWVLGSAVAQIAARALGGPGTFEATLAALGIATAIATLPALVPDLALTFVQAIGVMDYEPWFYSVTHGGVWFWIVWAYLGLYLLAFLVLYPAAIIAVHRLARGRAAVAGIAGFAAYQGFIFLFLR